MHAAVVADRYQVLGLIAAGGMGEVYRARMSTLGGLEKIVALKLVRAELAHEDRHLDWFFDEARVLLSMSHANVVQAFDVGTIADRYFIAMEYVDGLDVARLVKRSGPSLSDRRVPLQHALTVIVEALKGLDYAHRLRDGEGRQLGVVHRDVSPSNILVSFEGEVKVADFGLARSSARASRLSGGVGKIAYMAPEQLSGSAVDARADVYAMGAVLFETVAGRARELGTTEEQMIESVLAGRFAPLREVAREVPPELEAIVQRALALSPADRFPTAAAMRQELERFARARDAMLSTVDLADFVGEIIADDRETGGGPLDGPSGVRPSAQIDSLAPTPVRFDALLGGVLERVSAPGPLSVFAPRTLGRTTASVPAPKVASERDLSEVPSPEATVPAGQPRSTGRSIAVVASAALLGGLVVALANRFWAAADPAPPPAPSATSDRAALGDDAPVVTEPVVAPSASVSAAHASAPLPAAARSAAAPAEPPRMPATGPRAPDTAAPAVREADATLWVASEPWAWVYVDGNRVGRTMLSGYKLPPGAHVIRLENPAAQLERTLTVRLSPGEEKRLSVDLGRLTLTGLTVGAAMAGSDSDATRSTRILLRDGHAAGRWLRTYRLRVAGAGSAATRELGTPVVRVGSRSGNDVVLDDESVSRFHFEIEADDDGYRLRDLGSKNGTFVDGYRARDIYLRPGSTIRAGRIEMVFEPTTDEVEVPASPGDRFGPLVGKSLRMRELFATIDRVSKSDATVLIEGESGTGKELCASAIHGGGKRALAPFVIVDCGAIPANLLESELFGHERGAFTGAVDRRIGCLEEAHGGTLFLDELGELPLELQPKLLRALESRSIRRVGGRQSLQLDLRVVAATSRDVAAEVNRRAFRDDLYYRLAVVQLRLPPLRERVEDIPLLVEHLVRRAVRDDPARADRLLAGISQDTWARFASHPWRGNVRELRNVIERALALCAPGEAPQFDPEPRRASSSSDDGTPAATPAVQPQGGGWEPDLSRPHPELKAEWVARFDKEYVLGQLARHDGNISRAARASGLERMHFKRILGRIR